MKLDSYMPARLYTGRGAVTRNAAFFASFGSRCLIITGGGLAKKSGALDDCISALNTVGVRYEVFSEIEPNPQTKTCFTAGKLAREIGAEFIVGIGGGRIVDTAKAVADKLDLHVILVPTVAARWRNEPWK